MPLFHPSRKYVVGIYSWLAHNESEVGETGTSALTVKKKNLPTSTSKGHYLTSSTLMFDLHNRWQLAVLQKVIRWSCKVRTERTERYTL